MTGAAGGRLYSPEVLAAALELAAFPFDQSLPHKGEARSRSCGSSIALTLGTDAEGRISALGARSHACAVGQAAASVFARRAVGMDRTAIATFRDRIAAWLEGTAATPDWPGIELLEPAIAYPARHAAILLAWEAALAALPEPPLQPGDQGGEQHGGYGGDQG